MANIPIRFLIRGIFRQKQARTIALFYRSSKTNDNEYADPASNFQPEDVHGPSEVVDHSAYTWHDQSWQGLPFHDLIFYEVHVGPFTPEGMF